MLSTQVVIPPHAYVVKAEDSILIDAIKDVRQAGSVLVRCKVQTCYDIETGAPVEPNQETRDGVYVFFWNELGR